jgi:hypothetical protein
VTCKGLCMQWGFGGKSNIKNAMCCVDCRLYVVTESDTCACCGTPFKRVPRIEV